MIIISDVILIPEYVIQGALAAIGVGAAGIGGKKGVIKIRELIDKLNHIVEVVDILYDVFGNVSPSEFCDLANEARVLHADGNLSNADMAELGAKFLKIATKDEIVK